MGDTILIVVGAYAASGVVFALLCRSITRQKGYTQTGRYAVMGFFLNILALIYTAGLPDLKLRAALSGLPDSGAHPTAAAAALDGFPDDPGLIAAITAAVAAIWDGDSLAPAPGSVVAAAAGPAVLPAAGFVIRKVRRV
jgi:hypothetical protein